jgi:hypothetical protein
MSTAHDGQGRSGPFAIRLAALQSELNHKFKAARRHHERWRRTAQTDLRYTSPADPMLSDYFNTLINSSQSEADLKQGLHGFYARSLDQITAAMAQELPHLDSDLPAALRSQLLDLGAQQLLNETIADDPQFLSRLCASQTRQNLDHWRRLRDFLTPCIGQELSLADRFDLGLSLGLLPMSELIEFLNGRFNLELSLADQATILRGLELSRPIARRPLTYNDAIEAIHLFRGG